VGTAQLSTTQKKFGSTSLLLDGDSDYVSLANSSDFDFSTGDFTIECWFYYDQATAPQYSTIFDRGSGASNGFSPFWLAVLDDSGIKLVATCGTDGNQTNVINHYNLAAITNNTWYHVALVRHGSDFYIYLNGVSLADAVGSSSAALTDHAYPVLVGARGQSGHGSFWGGYIDEFRISKLCRYPSGTTFTPSTTGLPGESRFSQTVVTSVSGSGNTTTYSAGSLLDLATTTFNVDLTEAAEAAIANGDYLLFLDGGATGTQSKEALADLVTLMAGTGLSAASSVLSVDHDAATNFVANEHIDHTGVTLTAGVGLSGGGTIAANRTFTLDISEFSDVTPVNGDKLMTLDSDGSTEQLTTIASLATLMAGDGLAAASSVLKIDVNELTDLTNTTFGTANFGAGDKIAVADASASNATKRVKFPVEIGIAASDESTDLTTGTAKVTFNMPHAMTLTEVRANVNTAPVGSTILVDINEAGSTILSTKLMIDTGEKTSTTAATPAVISDTALADDAIVTIDIDQIGSSTAGKGLKIWLIGYR
jgi:hypothetical protein